MVPDGAPPERTLDVREVDGEPFSDIMAALDELERDETLLLINNFEPVPLYEVLKARGFAHEVDRPEPGVWHVRVRHA
ncbi:MAG: DUF2249 domain-containing protein [Halobacteriota archaeon]